WTYLHSRDISWHAAPQTVLSRLRRDALPIIGSEGQRRQAAAVVKIAVGVVGPVVAHGDRLCDFIAADNDGVIFDARFGPLPFLVFTGDGEAFQLAAFYDEAAEVVLE